MGHQCARSHTHFCAHFAHLKSIIEAANYYKGIFRPFSGPRRNIERWKMPRELQSWGECRVILKREKSAIDNFSSRQVEIKFNQLQRTLEAGLGESFGDAMGLG